MRFGVSVPNLGDARRLVDLGRRAEAAGWDGYFVWDHVARDHAGPRPATNPWVVLGALAATTERVRLGPLVTPLARRRPHQVATEATTLDVLSGGRAVLGIGLGAPAEEFDRFGDEPEPHDRAARLDEAAEIISLAMAGGPVRHAGEHYTVDATLEPTPVQRPRVPIWVAGRWPNPAPFERAARWDGVVPLTTADFPLVTPTDVRAIVAFVSERRDAGHAFDVVVSGHPAHTPSEYEAAGATWFIDSTASTPAGLDDLEPRIDAGPPRPA